MDALNVLCAQPMRDLFAIAKFLYAYQTCLRNSDAVTPCEGAKCRWGKNFAIFDQLTHYISQMIQDSTIVTMECQ